jgi:hypothetical protein
MTQPVSNVSVDFSGRRTGQRRSSLFQVHQEVCEEENQPEVADPGSSIPVVSRDSSKPKANCSGVLACDRCKNFGSECYSEPKEGETGDAAARLKEIETKTTSAQLEGLMSDLELEGWHLVSREEVEEPLLLISGST